MKKTVKAWAAIVPSTLVPVSSMSSDYVRGTRQFMLFCDPDAKEQAEVVATMYPERHRIVVPCTISYTLPAKQRTRKTKKR
jgi:hypothetical protein